MVGLTDIARPACCTRQNIRKYEVNRLQFPRTTCLGEDQIYQSIHGLLKNSNP